MPKKKKKAVVPRLRFPEFRDAGPWTIRTIEDLAERIAQGGTPKTSVAEYWNGEIPWITPAEMGNDAAHHYTKKTLRAISAEGLEHSSAELLPVNSVVVSSRAPIGYVTINTVEMATNQGCKGIVPKEGVYHEFLYFSLLVANQRLNDLGAGAGFKEISTSTLKAFRVPVPGFPEQQKIADCLSSLDELIRAEEAALETLKRHKKGLMQQLFPREGETTPRLRFPEFRDAGPWEVKRLGELLAQPPDYGVNAPAVPYSDELPTYLRITDINEDGVLHRNSLVSVDVTVADNHYLSEGDIVLARTGASVGKSYRYEPHDGKFVFAGYLIRIRPDNSQLDSIYLANYLTTQQYWQWVERTSARSGQPGINAAEYSAMPLPLPPFLEEQQKIADCLSSLDELIRAKANRIEALTSHKRGLMQQLFPQEVC